MDFSGRTVIITGGTGNLGQAIVRRFYDSGANVAIPYHSVKSLGTLSEDVRTDTKRTLLRLADLEKEGEVESFVSAVIATFGNVDFLIHAAGGYAGGNAVGETSAHEWDSMMTMNLKTGFLMTRAVLKTMMINNSGRILVIAAMPAVAPSPRKAAYAVSKGGLITLIESIAQEVKGKGITANAIVPSIILTTENKESMPDADHTKWVTPEEISSLMLFLCSDDARSINGNAIRIFGGM